MAMLMARHGRHRRHDNASSTVALKVGLRVVAALVEDANVRGTLRARQVNATLTSNHIRSAVWTSIPGATVTADRSASEQS